MRVAHGAGTRWWERVSPAMGVLACGVFAVSGVERALEAHSVAQVLTRSAPVTLQAGELLTFNASEKQAKLMLRAGVHGANGGMSFNGAQRGGREVVLPAGWRMQVTLVNEDNALPHSVIVVPATDSVPNRVTTPAFAGAVTADAVEGTLVGDSSAFSFMAERPGAYWLFCAVPGHGRAGMYLRLTVSRTARVPRYQ